MLWKRDLCLVSWVIRARVWVLYNILKKWEWDITYGVCSPIHKYSYAKTHMLRWRVGGTFNSVSTPRHISSSLYVFWENPRYYSERKSNMGQSVPSPASERPSSFKYRIVSTIWTSISILLGGWGGVRSQSALGEITSSQWARKVHSSFFLKHMRRNAPLVHRHNPFSKADWNLEYSTASELGCCCWRWRDWLGNRSLFLRRWNVFIGCTIKENDGRYFSLNSVKWYQNLRCHWDRLLCSWQSLQAHWNMGIIEPYHVNSIQLSKCVFARTAGKPWETVYFGSNRHVDTL